MMSMMMMIGLMSWVFANGDRVLIPGRMILDAVLLRTQHYKVRIKDKMEQSRDYRSTPPVHLGIVAIEKGAFGLSLIKVTNLLYIKA